MYKERQLLPAPPQLLPAPRHFSVIPKVPLAKYTKGQSGSLSGGDDRFSSEHGGRGYYNNLLLQPSLVVLNIGKLFYFAWFRHGVEVQIRFFI